MVWLRPVRHWGSAPVQHTHFRRATAAFRTARLLARAGAPRHGRRAEAGADSVCPRVLHPRTSSCRPPAHESRRGLAVRMLRYRSTRACVAEAYLGIAGRRLGLARRGSFRRKRRPPRRGRPGDEHASAERSSVSDWTGAPACQGNPRIEAGGNYVIVRGVPITLDRVELRDGELEYYGEYPCSLILEIVK